MASKRILIADDEERMRKLVTDFLKKEAYIIDEVADGEAAVEMFFSEKNYDLVILDVMMPRLDGWQVCKQIRNESNVPIMMLTAREQEADEVFGFEMGADEYVTKPFSPLVFVARVKALLKRQDLNTTDVLTYNDLLIDDKKHIVTVNDERIDLSPKEFSLLIYLARNEGVALSRDQILSTVWRYDYFGDSRTVDTHIKRLRLKLGEKGSYIQTVRGIGYRFEV